MKYLSFLRCLGCDRTSNNHNLFFLHLNGHKKNLRGTKRKCKDKEDEHLAVLQLSILSREVTSGRLVVKEELPQFVLGSKNKVHPLPGQILVPGASLKGLNGAEAGHQGSAGSGSSSIKSDDKGGSLASVSGSVESEEQSVTSSATATGGLSLSSLGSPSSIASVSTPGGSHDSNWFRNPVFRPPTHQPVGKDPRESKNQITSNYHSREQNGHGSGESRDKLLKGPERLDWSRVCNEGPARVEGSGEPHVGGQSARGRNVLLATPSHLQVNNPPFKVASAKVSLSDVKQERPASVIKQNYSTFEIDHPIDTAAQRKQVSPVEADSTLASPPPPNVNSNNAEVLTNRPKENCRQDKIKLIGTRSDVENLKRVFENAGKTLSMRSNNKYSNINTLDFLLKKSVSHFVDKTDSFTHGPHKSHDENKLDNSSEENVTWQLTLYGTDSDIKKTKLDFISFGNTLSQKTGQKFTNLAALKYLLKDNCDLNSNHHEPHNSNSKNSEANTTTFSPAFENTDVSERTFFLAAWKSIDHYGISLNNHGKICDGSFKITASRKRIGFTCKERQYQCVKCKWLYKLIPTPTFEGRGISDYCAAIALHSSGGVVNNLKRFCKHLRFSAPSTNKFQKGSFRIDVLRKVIRNRAMKAKEDNIARAVKK